MSCGPARTGSDAFPEFEPLLARARTWSGPGRLGLVLSGSHATGEAVWVADGPRRVSLSDLDLYAVVRDRRARAAAVARAAADGGVPLTERLERGLAAPFEVGFYTPSDLERLPARPGTLELRRHGRVLDGDPAVLARIPDWSGRDVSAEEVALLLENRAFELLWAWIAGRRQGNLDRLLARHAILKTALDLATVECLGAGEYPDGAAARVARARAGAAGGEEPPWDEALEFRRAPAPAADPDREWLRTARAWERAWRARVAGVVGEELASFDAARRAGARAPWRRRVRQALEFRPRSGAGGAPSLGARLARFAAGTPVHRLNASAAVLVALRRCALETGPGGEPPATDMAGARAALAALGVVDPALAPEAAARALLSRWDAWVLDGRRFGEQA